MQVNLRKVVISKPGSYERLGVQSSQIDLVPGPSEVLIEAHAAGVNYADCVIRMGLYQSAKEFVGWPITPGFEYSGKVLEVGKDVKHLSRGQEVFGVTRFGAYASHLVMDSSYVFSRPPQLNPLQAAGFPAVFLTAYYPLYELLRLRSGQKVLIHSAAGGVGGALIQLAKIGGCEVVGVVGSSHKVATARELGADAVIDKSRESLWGMAEKYAPKGYDIILDANGVSTLRESYRHVASAGKLVIYGFHSMLPKSGGKPNWIKLACDFVRTPRFDPLKMTNDNRSVLAFNLSYLFERKDIFHDSMNQLIHWLEDGSLKPLKVTPFAFEDVVKAHQSIESGQTTGKLVLQF